MEADVLGEKNFPEIVLSTMNFATSGLESNLGVRGERRATNCLSDGTTSVKSDVNINNKK